jgi:uncharacterized protein
MLRRSKIVWGLLLALAVVFLAAGTRAEKIQDLKPTGYVNDFAGVLSPQTISSLDSLCQYIDQKGGAQIAVVTVKNLDGDEIDDYAVKLEEAWKVGPKATDRGVLILFAIDDHKYRIEVGYGLEPIIPDGRAGEIGRSVVPYLRQGDYNAAVTSATQQVAEIIAADAKIPLNGQAEQAVPQRNLQPISPLKAILGLIFLLILLVVLLRHGGAGLAGFLLGMFLGGGGGGGGGFGGGGGGGGFGGFGGGGSGGGGASGSW